MNKEIKIIFSDIDWTLLNHGHNKHEFDLPSIKALIRAQSLGIKVFLCTARPYDSIKCSGILNLIKPDGIVCTNGAVVFIGNKLIHNHYFPKEFIRDIIRISHKHHLTVELSNEVERWFSKKKNGYVDKYFEVFNETIPPIRKYNNEDISAILIMAPAKYDETLLSEFPKGTSFVRFADYGIDLHTDPIYKSEGVDKVLEYYGYSKDNALAIGDDLGDIPMFEAVKYSVCMENGKTEAKNTAKEICPHIDNHGVVSIIKKYFNV